MFDSDLDARSIANPQRRVFLGSAITAVGGMGLWSWRKPHVMEALAAKAGPPKEVTIVRFSDPGQRLEKVRVMQVVKSEDKWRKQLSSGAFEITRHADTEIAYSGKYWNLHDKGIYRCICCDNA